MEALVAIVLIVLAIPVISIVALVSARTTRDQMRRLEARLSALEERIASSLPPAAQPSAPKAPVEPEPVAWPSTAVPETPPARTAPSETTPIPEAPRAAAQAAGLSFEERFGTRWTVWVGGVALALGGIFLVRYSIEAGLLGPGMRIFLGGLLAVALVATGEWTRRKENLSGIAGLPSAHIPGVLTAAGTTVAYATAYAAYALYGFLAPAAVFALLGIIALATLVAALLHGPALAALGLVGAFIAPLLVETDVPNYWALYLYLTVVTGAAFALARARLWPWLAVTAAGFGVLWILAGLIDDSGLVVIAPLAFYAIAGFVLAAILIVSGFLFGPDPIPGRFDGVSPGMLAAFVLGAAALVVLRDHDGAALLAFTGLVAATVVVAWRAEAAVAAVAAAAVLVALVMADWAVDTGIEHLIAPPGPLGESVPTPARAAFAPQLVMGFGFAALFGGAGFLAQGRSEQPLVSMLWAAAAVFAPVAILVALYYRIAEFDRSVPFAAMALLLAALYGVATELLTKRALQPGVASAAAIFAVGAIASLALAVTMVFEKGWLTVALALMVPGIAYVAEQRPLPILRWLAAAAGMLVLARIAWDPRIVGDDIGTTPIFNWLLWGYGIPALSFWFAGSLLRRRADDVPARMADSLAILFTVLLAGLQIRHFVNDGNIYRNVTSLAELALQVCSGLAIAIGLERVRGRTRNIVHDYGALIVAGSTLVLIVGLLMNHNPLFTGEPVGGRFVNLVLLGYGLPAALAIVLALVARDTRPMAYRGIAAVTAVVLALAYLTLEVRTLFHGPFLHRLWMISDAEQYTYSVVWLAFGVVLLLVGIALGSKPARLASAAVIVLTIGKVFLVDMAGLQGVYRALSFIGLGIVLVGIGWLYQRLLFPVAAGDDRPPAGPAASTSPS